MAISAKSVHLFKYCINKINKGLGCCPFGGLCCCPFEGGGSVVVGSLLLPLFVGPFCVWSLFCYQHFMSF